MDHPQVDRRGLIAWRRRGPRPGLEPGPGRQARPRGGPTHGKVRGASGEGVQVFKGVRYGSRHRRRGTLHAAPAAQALDRRRRRPGLRRGLPAGQARGRRVTAEDCLFLNVWTPATGKTRRRREAAGDVLHPRRRLLHRLGRQPLVRRDQAGQARRRRGGHGQPPPQRLRLPVPGPPVRRPERGRQRQCRPAGPGAGPAMGARQHRRVRRRSRATSCCSASRAAAPRSPP